MNKITRKDLVTAGAAFVLLYIILQAVFYSENPITIMRTSLGIFWLFYLPGNMILYYWHDKLDDIERSIAGLAVGIALTSLVSYFLTPVGFPIRMQWIVVPIIIIAAGIVILRFKGPLR